MSNELKGISQAPASDPEKGLLVSHYTSTLSKADVDPAFPLSRSKEKDTAVTITTKEVIAAKNASEPPPKPKKVPLWIVWTLWFNTYRYIG